METTDGIESEEYIYALGDVINPQLILNYGKISNDRIRIYLKDEATVKQIINN